MKTVRTFPLPAILAAAALALAGCTGSPSATGTPSLSSAPSASTPAGGGPTGASQTPPSSAPDSPSASSSEAAPGGEPTVLPTTASVTIYYIAVGDGGTSGPEVGCGDSAVAATSPAVTFTDPVEAALKVLLGSKDEEIGQSGLRNALWQSDLAVTGVDRSTTPITVHLEGTLSLAGECDIPRAEQQLMLTAKDAAGAPVDITVNGKPLSEALSLK